jgi:4-hydroxy-4-methyl-2-oxoglutarate aldolase
MPVVHVIRTIGRVSKDFVNDFRGKASATVHEAYGKSGYIDYSIRAIGKGMKICGPAFTVTCPPGDNMMLHKALEIASEGDVLVVTCANAFDYGYFGGLMATSAMAKKLGGLVIEGCIRDSSEIIEKGFPIFSKGICIRGTGKGTLGLINYPIIIGGTAVFPGDLIIGDDDGLVVVKKEDVGDVLEKTVARIEKEIVKEEVLSKGVSSVEYNHFGPLFEAVGLVEEC